MAWLTQTVRAARACTTDREKQIKAMTFAFISHAEKTQTPFCFAKYHKHISNCSYNQNPPFLGSWSGLLFYHLSFCNHSCCAFAHRNALRNFNHIWQKTIAQLFPSQEIPWGIPSGRGTVETAGWISPPTGCHDFLSSSFLLHLFVVSPRSVFLPGSGNRLPHGWFPSWKCCENSISSLNGISAFGEISEQSAHAQRCQILQMLGSSDKTGIMWGSLLNPPHLWSSPRLTPWSCWPWHENRTEEEWGSCKPLLVFDWEDSLILLWTVCFSWRLQKWARSLVLFVCGGNKNLNLETS